MSGDIENMKFVLGDKTLVFPCIEVMALSVVPKADCPEGYAHFYDAFERRLGDKLSFYRLSNSTKWKPFTAKDRGKVSGWFSDARSLKEVRLGVDVHTGAVGNEPRPPVFQMMFEHIYKEYPRGMFRIVYPLTAADDPQELLGLVDDAMAEFPIHWGTAGYSFYSDVPDITTERQVEAWQRPLLMRYPGLSTGRLYVWGGSVEDGVCSVGWLTFLGDALLDKVGGRQQLLAQAKSAGIASREYKRGIALQAGNKPELGDVNRNELLPNYRRVGEIVAPLFAPDDRLQHISVADLLDANARLDWLKRFIA